MSGDSAMFSSIDKNNDGQISRSEWDAYQRSAASGASGSPSSAPASRSGASHGVGTK
jgi:Ca2+-binding EF-hand superfamily protein